jgi:serine/threonine protein kinase
MPLCKSNLSEYLDKTKFSFLKIRKFLLQITDALKYLRDEKMIHKDVKPSNILVESPHKVVLADFGMMSKNGATSVFCAPEQLTKSEIEKTDVHAFGITILFSFYTFTSAMELLFLSKKDVR